MTPDQSGRSHVISRLVYKSFSKAAAKLENVAYTHVFISRMENSVHPDQLASQTS